VYGSSGSPNANASPAAIIFAIIVLALAVFYIVAEWRIYTKAGKPGWAVIVPIYSTLVLLRIVGRPWWWILLFLIPLVNIVLGIIVVNDLSKSFGHGAGFTLGLIFLTLIFIPILAFGSSQYVGPGAEK
jgi:hypothetical protein